MLSGMKRVGQDCINLCWSHSFRIYPLLSFESVLLCTLMDNRRFGSSFVQRFCRILLHVLLHTVPHQLHLILGTSALPHARTSTMPSSQHLYFSYSSVCRLSAMKSIRAPCMGTESTSFLLCAYTQTIYTPMLHHKTRLRHSTTKFSTISIYYFRFVGVSLGHSSHQQAA